MAQTTRLPTLQASDRRRDAERRRLVESLILALGVGGSSIVLLLANAPK